MAVATKAISEQIVQGTGSTMSDFSNEFLSRLARRFSCLWDRRDNGDCKIRIELSNGKLEVTKKRTRNEALDSHVIMCHSAVLSAGSEYFFKRLQSSGASSSSASGTDGNADGDGNLQYANGKEGGLTLLVEHMVAEDLTAFECMVKFFYLGAIDESLSFADLLELHKVADRFAASECCEAARHSLLQSLSEGISDTDFNVFYEYEPANLDGWKTVESTVECALAVSFRGAEAILTDESLLERWCQLTWKAVRRLLTCNMVDLYLEEVVACLLIHWLSYNTDLKNLTDRDRAIISDIESNGLLRYGCLVDVGFVSLLVASCPWLVQAQRHVHELFRYLSLGENHCGVEFLLRSFKSPPIWYVSREPVYHGDVGHSDRCKLEIDQDTFVAACKKYPAFPPIMGKTYYKGWNLTMSIAPSIQQVLCVWISMSLACPINAAHFVYPSCEYVRLNYRQLKASHWEPDKGIGFTLCGSAEWNVLGDINTLPPDFFKEGKMIVDLLGFTAY